MRRRILALPVAIAIVAVPGALAAQACVGSPVAESHNGVTAQVGFLPQDGMAYGAALRHNMAGPFSLSAGYSLASYENVEPKHHSFGGDVSYELAAPSLPASVCPTVGLGYSRVTEDPVTISALTIPVGVGIGRSFELSPKVSVIPHVVPQWVWARGTVDVDGDKVSDNDSWLAALVGATFSTSRFYFGGGFTFVDQEDSEPVFSIMGGMPF